MSWAFQVAVALTVHRAKHLPRIRSRSQKIETRTFHLASTKINRLNRRICYSTSINL